MAIVSVRPFSQSHPCRHPVIFLKETSAEDLRAVIQFIYNGEVNVSQTQLASFIKTAEMLHIKGLSADSDTEDEQVRWGDTEGSRFVGAVSKRNLS